ncbi:MAG TPA: glutamate-1-semialdehyde 2,1-aminomutase [Planctomycetota bacterium]|nr:glutamate-1-semialdehyde 2,1-aminomutase [Planctomycetota bacterium]
MARPLSDALFRRAGESLVGGVNSPVRSFRAVGGSPIFAARGEGPYLWDADGNRYVDLLMSWGACLLGHAHPAVVEAIAEAAARGASFGLSTERECELAEVVKEAFPSIELLRLVSSGTEAVMSAVRLARGFTGREKIVTFEGGYHGHSDGLLVRAGSGLATFGLPASAGVPASFAAASLPARYNDLESVQVLARAHGDDLACILVEPVAGNMGVVPPEPGFLSGLRDICDRTGALLIFDEVITGFRLAWGGAQELHGVRPDLTTLGKVVGGGLPVGVFGGRRRVMERLAPLGDVYQAGTLSGNPVATAAGLATLATLRTLRPYGELERRASRLAASLSGAARSAGVPVQINRAGSMFTVFFCAEPVRDFASAQRADAGAYARFFHAMLEGGVLLPPSQLESAFLSTAHAGPELAEIQTAAEAGLGAVLMH